MDRLNEYRVMWVMVLFDLPTVTKMERKLASGFRKDLKDDGFTMFQYSIYLRHCASVENAETHIKRVSAMVPDTGNVVIVSLTDKQFGNIKVFNGKKYIEPEKRSDAIQLELF